MIFFFCYQIIYYVHKHWGIIVHILNYHNDTNRRIDLMILDMRRYNGALVFDKIKEICRRFSLHNKTTNECLAFVF